MEKKYSPNRDPFPRGRFLKGSNPLQKIHPLRREANTNVFQQANPRGYQHDLGAQDVFLDNFGLFLHEQVTRTQWQSYASALDLLMLQWELLKYKVLQKLPYWGRHYNSATRKANAGEPRSLIRWIADQDCSRIRMEFLEQLGVPVNFDCLDRPAHDLGELLGVVLRWDSKLLVDPNHFAQPIEHFPYNLTGVPLPPHLRGPVESIKILPPHCATPDLPVRVGCDKSDFKLYKRLLRNQEQLGTCTSHAVSVALDLLFNRKKRLGFQFSPAWLHCSSGTEGAEGRCLRDVLDALRSGLPCQEKEFPYDLNFNYLKAWRGDPSWKTAARRTNSESMTQEYGLPVIHRLDVRDVAGIKKFLAAGWPVIVTTAFPDSLRGPGFLDHGLGLVPYPGQGRSSGHAWLLVGYDHVDGNQWKYQGSFISLNSWGAGFPSRPHSPDCAGLCYLPFALLLTEGHEAYALTLPQFRASRY